MFIEKALAAAKVIEVPSGIFTGGAEAVTPGSIANGILGLMTSFAYPLAFLAVMYSAFLLISSAGKPEAMVTAKKNISYVVIGIFLIVFAVVFVKFITGIFS